MNIEMIPYSEENLLPEGKYLVKSKSTSQLKTIQFLQVKLTNVHNEKKKKSVNRLDMTNQIPLLISSKPIL